MKGRAIMFTNEASINRSTLGGREEPINKQRRALIGGIGGAMAAMLASPGRVRAEEENDGHPGNPFILLLHGIYQPVADGPDLGLSVVNLDDGTYSSTRIYPVFGFPEGKDQDRPIGTFYVQFAGNLCAYDLPGGALAMRFNGVPAGAPAGFNGFVPFPDGKNGHYLEGTFELVILEATGVYRAFQGGHNHMVDRLHQMANGSFDEFCFCNISQYQFP
jgi:hypothetical protein